MAEPHEETVGAVPDAPPHSKEAPIAQKDVVKENGELPASESLAEIVGKEKEDYTLSSSAPDIPAPVENGGEYAIPSEEAKEDRKTGTEAIAETAPSADASKKTEEKAPESEEAENEPPEEGIPQSSEPHEETAGIEQAEETPVTTEKAPSEEIPVPAGEKVAEVEETPKTADTAEPEPADRVAEEHTTKPLESAQTEEPKTELAEGVDNSKTDEPETQVGEAGASKSSETEEKEAVAVGEEETPKPVADDASELAGEAIPRTVEVADTDQLNAAEVAADEIPKTPDATENKAIEPQITEGSTPKPSDANEPKAEELVVNEEQPDAVDSTGTEEPQAKVTSNEEDSAADKGESIPTEGKEAEEPKSVEDATHEEVPTLASETGEKEAEKVGEEETPKPDEKADGAREVAEEEIPKTVDVTETDQPNAAEVAAEEIPKTSDTTENEPKEPQITEDNAPKPSEADEPKAEELVVNKKQQDAVDSPGTEETETEVTSKEEDSAGEPTATEETEPENVDEATHEEVRTPEEQPAAEAEEPSKPKSFWGVVLKHVEPSVKSPLEEDSTGAPSSNSENSNDVDKSPEEAHEQETVAHPLADIAEQKVASGSAAASDLSPEKEGEVGVEEAPKETESQSTPTKEALEEVSGRAEPSENATTETSEPMEQGNAGSAKESELPTSEVEEKEIPPFTSEISKGFPERASEETVPELSERTAESTEEPEEILTTTTPEQEPVGEGQEGQYTTEHLTQETHEEAKPEEESSVPVKEDAVEQKEAGDDGSGLEKQPSLSVYIPKQEQPVAAGEGDTAEDTTPRGTPLMQRVEQLEQKLAQHESRQSPRSDLTSTGHSTPRSSIVRPIRHSARHVLEETGSKGTLLDRVAALEQKLTYYLNVHHTSPSNGQSTPPIAEDLASELDSKPAETETRDWSSSAAEGDKTPEQVNEETSKAAQDPIKPTTEEKSPADVPAQNEGMAPSRSTSINERKLKAKAAVGQIKGFITGCFSPKKGKPVSTSS